MKNLIVCLFFFWSVNNLFSQQELNAYLKTASENNPALKSAFSEYRAALEKLPQAKALPDPNLMFQYFTTPLYLEMGKERFTLSASQTFPWFGQLKAQEQAAAEMAKSKYESFINERNKLFKEVKEVYFKLYVQHKSVQLSNENLELLRSMRELAKIKFETGKGSFVNVLRSDMEIAELENKLAYLKDSELPLRAELEKFLNTKISTSLVFPDTLWKDSLPDAKTVLMDSIAAHNPSLKQIDYDIASWEKQMEAAKKTGYPSFTIGATYMNMSKRIETNGHIHNNGKDMYMFPEIGVMIPLNRKKYNAMVNEAKYNSESSTYEKVNRSNELNSELETGYRDYLDAQRRMILYTRLYNLAKNARELLLSTFSAAGTDFEEVLRMQQEELMYALELEDARAMLNASVATINYLTGKQ
ncbi:MAG: TolC family protein [Bacteroidetes bacterium]|nr:TolC family protein [Bacteroidota bacterium]